MKKTHGPSRSNRVPVISPEVLLPLIQQGDVTYVEFEEFIYFHYTIIKVLEMLKEKGKPIAVHIRSIDNDVFSLQSVRRTLSQFAAVDYIVEDTLGDFSLLHKEESLRSNTYFFGKDINARSEELIDRRRSYYHTPLTRVSVKFPKYLKPDQLIETLKKYEKEGKTVALVTGVFDVLHPGHILFLENAKKNADILIVLVNSDFSASHQPKNREHDRPVHRLHERVGVLNALEFTTHIVPFDSDNILPIIEELPANIIYVKTMKDKTRKSIMKEINLVKGRGGKTKFIPNIRNKSGSVISSTMLIRACREKDTNQEVLFDEGWPSVVHPLLADLLMIVQNWDQRTGHISRLKAKLRERYDGSFITAVIIEHEAVEEIYSLASRISDSLEDKRKYHAYILPYLIGKLLDFPVKIVPVQYRKKGLPYGMINSAQRLGGKIIFFDLEHKKMYKPLIYEKYFWKKMPHHTLYEVRPEKRSFAQRIYTYSESVHFRSLAVKMLSEELEIKKKSQAEGDKYLRDIELLMGKMWENFEKEAFQADVSRQRFIQFDKRIHRKRYPGIVAHGGAAVLSPKDPRAENSASGIRTALKKGVDIVEIDICVCKDGWVVSHDRFLELGTTSEGLVTEKTEAELRKVSIKLSSGKPSSEKMITVADALKIVAEERLGDPREIYVKIDIKLSHEDLEKKLIDIILKSGIPLEKVLVTSQLVETNKRLREMCPKLPTEFNTVETNLYLLAYKLIHNELMLGFYLDYVIYYSQRQYARTVSLAQFVIPHWGEEFVERFIVTLQAHRFYVQLWVASSVDEYLQCARLYADYVLMQDPFLITRAIRLKKQHDAKLQ